MGEYARSSDRGLGWYGCYIAAAVVLASLPAWSGGWIYDDWAMAKSPLMQTLQDVPLAFARTSADYLGLPNAVTVAGVTYRPLTMAGLIATQAAFGTPLAHHVVSLLLHFCVVLLLARPLLAACGRAVGTLLVATFAMHPMNVEAYGWINGRSDLMAGLGLTLLVLGLTTERSATGARVLAFLGAMVCGQAKETGLIAAAVVCAAYSLPSPAGTGWQLRKRAAVLFAAFLGAVLSVLPRVLWAKMPSTGLEGVISDLTSPGLLFQTLGLCLESMLVPMPRTMLGLAWELEQPMSALRIVLGGAALGAWVWTVATRRFRASALLAGALLVVVPCLSVRHGFWHGFDRYLYMPAIMISLALGSLAPISRRIDWRSRAAQALLAVWLVLLFASCFATATAYANQPAFIRSVIGLRPHDPTGRLMAASAFVNGNEVAQANPILDELVKERLPPALALHLIGLLRATNREREELQVADELDARAFEAPIELHGLVSVWLYHRELARAFVTARRLRGKPPFFCTALVDLVRGHVERGTYTRAERVLALEFLARPTCRTVP